MHTYMHAYMHAYMHMHAQVLARLEGVPEDDLEMVVASKFEYVVTCQIYGKLKAAKRGSEESAKADAIDELRRQYACRK